MAESAHYFVELLAKDLLDLNAKNLLESDEIRTIARQIRDFEYRLQRRVSKESDWCDYVEFMETLQDLLRERRARILTTSDPNSDDQMCKKKIHQIFTRMLRKFPHNLDAWSRYIGYCQKTKSNQSLESVFAEALQLHPSEPALWIRAAQWEALENSNMPAARSLFMRALSMLPEYVEIWLGYFEQEASYIEKLYERNLLLEVPTDGLEDLEQILLTIYQNAAARFQGFKVHEQFLGAARAHRKYLDRVAREIYLAMEHNFKGSAELAFFQTKEEIDANPADDRAIESIASTIEAKRLNSSCLLEIIQLPSLSDRAKERFFSHLSHDKTLWSNENLFKAWVAFITQGNNFQKAAQVLEEFLLLYPKNESIWLLRIQLEAKNSCGDLQHLGALVEQAQKNLNFSPEITCCYLDVLSKSTIEKEKLRGIAIQQLKNCSSSILDWLLNWNTQAFGVPNTREQYRALKKETLDRDSFIRCCLVYERSLPLDPDCKAAITVLFEELCRSQAATKDALPWIDYAEWLVLDANDWLSAAALYDRVQSVLSNEAEERIKFIAAYDTLKVLRSK